MHFSSGYMYKLNKHYDIDIYPKITNITNYKRQYNYNKTYT